MIPSLRTPVPLSSRAGGRRTLRSAAVVVAVVGALVVALSPTASADALIGGTPVAVGERPYYASVTSPLGGCGGAMIGAEWVITARHCVAKAMRAT